MPQPLSPGGMSPTVPVGWEAIWVQRGGMDAFGKRLLFAGDRTMIRWSSSPRPDRCTPSLICISREQKWIRALEGKLEGKLDDNIKMDLPANRIGRCGLDSSGSG